MFRFTEHDQTLQVDELGLGILFDYVPAGGFDASARNSESLLAGQDVEARGIISSSAITEADLIQGKFDNAKVEELLVDWYVPWLGEYKRTRYNITVPEASGEFWVAQLDGLANRLDRTIGRRFTRNCQFRLGDSDTCRVDLNSFNPQFSKTVTSITTQRRVFRTGTAQISGALGDGYFEFGEVTFRSGNNAGISGECKVYTNSTREIELQVEMPNDIAVSDSFDILVGCDRLKATCNTKFSNILNYGGDPFAPGQKAIITPVTAKK